MSTESIERQQQKSREFMSLLPLTTVIAGLADSEPGKYFSEAQMENRAISLRTAYKVARQVIMDVAK